MKETEQAWLRPLQGNAMQQGLWGLIKHRRYSWALFRQDTTAALLVSLLLIPQSLAYALLAGLPLQTGLYASILPAIVYALVGSSGVLAVGPVAITSLLTFSALSPLAEPGSSEYLSLAIILALMSGVCLMLMSLLRMGFLANFLSHPVMSGFISASALIIVISQLKGVTGIPLTSGTLPQMLASLYAGIRLWHGPTLLLGAGCMLLLYWGRRFLTPQLMALGLAADRAQLIARMAPMLLLIGSTLLVASLRLDQQGIQIVGALPLGFPDLALPSQLDPQQLLLLLPLALMISLIGFAESVAIARTFAAKRRQQVNSNRELMGLGLANLAAGFSASFPVTGGLSRSVVNYDAGAVTPVASLLTGIGMALALLFLTGWLYYLPQALLSAVILIAVSSLVQWRPFVQFWRYSRSDAWSWLITFAGVLLLGLEWGLLAGILASLGAWLAKNTKPHVAIVGRVPETEHYRNTERYQVELHPQILSLRIDESLMFANAQEVEQRVLNEISKRPEVEHVILMGSGINHIDASGVEMLEQLNQLLGEQSIQLHLSEIKGPVLDRLKLSPLLPQLSGQLFLTQHQAMQHLLKKPESS